MSPGTAIVGFPPGSVTGGTIHSADGPAAAAQSDLTVAYNDAAGRTVPTVVAGDLGGLTLPPGLYKSTSTLGITGVLTLDGQGNPNSVFIFQVGSGLTTAVSSQVTLVGGAQAANIFWQVGSSATLGTSSIFKGSILAQASVSLGTGAALDGRALARTGAVTMISNTIVNPGPPTAGVIPSPLTITCPSTSAQTGVAYTSLLVARGGTPPYLFSVAGSLPPGLTLNASTGAITGTPTSAASSIFTAAVTDAASRTATSSCSITAVSAPVTPLPLTLACPVLTARISVPYSSSLLAAGGTLPYSFSIAGPLPAGLTLDSSTGSITGTPTAGGVSSFTATVTDPGAQSATQSCNITTPASVAPIPSPSSWQLVMLGVASVMLYRSRERMLQLVRGVVRRGN